MSDTDVHKQLELLRARVRPAPPPTADVPAPALPVARVAVDVPLAHLDRPFDYAVPAALDEEVVPGCRVSVRFAGKQVRGFVLERVAASDHPGRLGPVAKVVSSEIVLLPEVARLVRHVADRYAGTFADVVRLAVPPRHARAEQRTPALPTTVPVPEPDSQFWLRYDGGRFLAALAAGQAPRAAWAAAPGDPPERALAEAIVATAHAGRGAIVCLPDTRDVARMDETLTQRLGAGHHVVLTADLGPSARYAAFLALSRGDVRVVLGTRGAAFAPVHDLGLVAIWDDGDDLHAEQRAPYPHAREVLLTRALDPGVAVLIGGYARTCEAQQLVESGWCTDVALPATERRSAWPRVAVAGGDDTPGAAGARLPHGSFELVRGALADGPVLVQVPRAGYRTALACAACRTPARCANCHGPLAQADPGTPPTCRWCGCAAETWTCPTCQSHQLRAPVIGNRRTAEELGRAFPQTLVRTSAGSAVLDRVEGTPAIVVATPGAEPRADGGYAAALLMDTWLTLGRADLRTGEEAVRRWLAAVALVRPGGRVLVVGDPAMPSLQALVRADPVGHAVRELGERRQTHFPPAVRLASLEAGADVLAELASTSWPQPCEVLGPVPTGSTGEEARLVVRVPRRRGAELARTLQRLQAGRSLHKDPPVRVRVDPVVLG